MMKTQRSVSRVSTPDRWRAPRTAAAMLLLAFWGAAYADCDFHGQKIKEGQGVQAFKDAYVATGTACDAQMRTCRGGKLAGGYFQPSCKPVSFVKPADTRPFRRSDVMFTLRLPKQYYSQPWYEKFSQFQANRIVWTYAGEELLQDPRVTGKIPVQCALEYWVPANHPQRDEMSCPKKDSAGNFAGYAQHPVYKLRVPDTNTKAWRDYASGKAKELVFLGCSSFVQDVPAIMATTRNTRSFIGDGCHSEESESLFKAYKKEQPSGSYPDFMRYSVNQYHDWLHENIRAAARGFDPDYKVYFSGNTSAASPAHLLEDAWFFPKFDFLQGEVFGDFSHNNATKTVVELMRYLEAKKSAEHPVVLTLRSDSTKADNVAYLRRATMSTYAFGMVPMIPWTASAMTDNPLLYFFGDPRDFADIYKMVRSWPKLFDSFNPADLDQVIVPGKTYNASQTLKASSQDVLVVSRSSIGKNSGKGVFVVNWGNAGQDAWIDLRKTDFIRKPNLMIRPGDAKPVPIAVQDNGDYYRYRFASLPEWVILFSEN